MRKPTKLILYVAPLLLAASCDTTEEGFFVAEEPTENEVLSIDNSQLSFTPEGATYEINVSSVAAWSVTLTGSNAAQFTVTPMSGRGNGVITVSAAANQSDDDYRATLQITPQGFDMDPLKVSVVQSYTDFRITDSPSSETTAEEGGSVNMTARCSVDWMFEVLAHDADGTTGDIEWLTVSPGMSGAGDESSPQDFRFTWKPNYTEQERTIRLQFRPQSESITGKNESFTLKQAAGTKPQNVRCDLTSLDIVNANVSFEYSSRSSIKDCGVILYKVSGGSADSIATYRPAGDFVLNASYAIAMTELEENTTFQLVPFCINEVGNVRGNSVEFTTETKPENMVYQGIEIVNANSGGVAVETDLTSATLTMTVTSDVTPLQNRIASAVMTFDGKTVNGSARMNYEGNWTYTFRTADAGVELTPNKEYDYQIVITGTELPRSQGQVVNPNATLSGKFKTQGRTPSSDDNDKPTTGS